MKFGRIEDLLTLEQERSFSKAAERRFVSQSAFTRRIQQLEQALGYAILERNSRYMEFTDLGQIFLATAKSIEQQLNATLALLNNLNRSNEVTIKFAVVHSLSSTFFSKFLRLFPDYIKDFKIELVAANVGEGFKLLKEGACDFLICYSDENKLKAINSDVLTHLKLGDTEIVPVTLIDEDGNAKYDINHRFPLLSYSKNAYLRNLVDQVISNKLEYRILYETDHANNLKDFVLQGAGIAWLPKITIEEDLLKKKLKIINAREYIIKQQIFIFKNKIRKDDYLKIFWDSLRNIEFNTD